MLSQEDKQYLYDANELDLLIHMTPIKNLRVEQGRCFLALQVYQLFLTKLFKLHSP